MQPESKRERTGNDVYRANACFRNTANCRITFFSYSNDKGQPSFCGGKIPFHFTEITQKMQNCHVIGSS